ncbi:hypothetical protein LTR09_011951 [Extremus antarcticus]|uniref:N-acetyltransferase domain-containing protein n=1 Tax=Extremus antarcticus TaxID=702011 RepID=A0AAJ0D5L1_9PEZI|nr:hypothetical protein LTR09_011951 [Extremus antarcticus]
MSTMASEIPTTLRTERLKLRMVNPDSLSDLQELIGLYTAYHTRSGGATPSIANMDDIRLKHELMGPRAEFCTLTPPPKGMFHLIYLLDGDTPIGHIAFSFRSEMPCPDVGYAILPSHEGRGYASEAGREVVRFWQDVIGVKEIFIGTSHKNLASQGVARRMGFVEGGSFEVVFGLPPNERSEQAKAFVLPGMKWPSGQVLRHTLRRK